MNSDPSQFSRANVLPLLVKQHFFLLCQIQQCDHVYCNHYVLILIFDANHLYQLLKCCGILAIHQIFLHLIDSPTRQNCSCFIVICLLGILSSAIAFFCPHVNTSTESLCSVRIHHLPVAIDLGAGMINSSFTKPEKSFLERLQVI